MLIQAFPENIMEKIIPEDNEIAISIRDSGRTPIAVLNGGFKAVLYLQFSDIDNPPKEFIKKYGLTLFSKKHARKILEFVDFYKPNKISINCMAGISRSVGVMVALEEIYNKNKDIYTKFPLANKHVYKTIMEVYYESK